MWVHIWGWFYFGFFLFQQGLFIQDLSEECLVGPINDVKLNLTWKVGGGSGYKWLVHNWYKVAIAPAAVRVKIIYPAARWITSYWPGKENKYDHDVSWHTVASEWDLI